MMGSKKLLSRPLASHVHFALKSAKNLFRFHFSFAIQHWKNAFQAAPFAMQKMAARLFEHLHVALRAQLEHVAIENFTHAYFCCELQLIDAANFRCARVKVVIEPHVVQLQHVFHPCNLANFGRAQATFGFDVVDAFIKGGRGSG